MKITPPDSPDLDHRIRHDFSLDREAAYAALRHEVADATPEDFDRWETDLEHRDLDGERRYFRRAVTNLFRLNTEAAGRRTGPPAASAGQLDHLGPVHERLAAAGRSGTQVVQTLRATHTLTVDADAVPAGTALRAWLPFPREIAHHQSNPILVSATAGGAEVEAAPAPNSERQRTVFLTADAVSGEPTEFTVTWQVEIAAQWWPTSFPISSSATLIDEEPPHIVFSPAVREFARRIVGHEPGPPPTDRASAEPIAHALFAAMDQVPWAGALEYSTHTCIPDYVISTGHGDCGMQTLTMISMLRLYGIGARWQSGWVFADADHTHPSYNNLHDWGWLAMPEVGWIPFDVTTGLLDADDPALANFYFGGLDPHRVVFNDDIGGSFSPAKTFPRSDSVDNQRGEVESDDGNLYYDQWSYRVDTSIG